MQKVCDALMGDKPDHPFFEGSEITEAPEGAQFPAPWADADPSGGPIFRVTPLMRWMRREIQLGPGLLRVDPILQQAWWCSKDLILFWRDVP